MFFPVWQSGGADVPFWNLAWLWEPARSYGDPRYFLAVVFQSIISLTVSVFFVVMTAVAIWRLVVAWRRPTKTNFHSVALSFLLLNLAVAGVLFSRAFMLAGQFHTIVPTPGLVLPLACAALSFLISFFVPDNFR